MLETFFDSEYLSQDYSWQDETYTVHLQLWNAKPAKIIFKGVIGFCVFSIMAFPMGFRYEASQSKLLHDALSTLYKTIPENHEYKCYEIIDVDEVPFIKVVAKGYEFVE